MTHTHPLRVYYEDTDLSGLVYHANYLRFIERGRSEWVRSLGIDQTALKRDAGTVFAVSRIEADYLSPARFDDQLTVITAPMRIAGASALLHQDIIRGDTRLFAARVTIVALGPAGRPRRLPGLLRDLA